VNMQKTKCENVIMLQCTMCAPSNIIITAGTPGNSLVRNYYHSLENINFIAERSNSTNVRMHDKTWMNRKVRSVT
jgi:hypothetical protein